MEDLNVLDIGHAYAPDYAPPFCRELIEQIIHYSVEYREVQWFLLFVMIVYRVYRLSRIAWRMLRRLVRSEFDDDELEDDERERRARAHRRKRRARRSAAKAAPATAKNKSAKTTGRTKPRKTLPEASKRSGVEPAPARLDSAMKPGFGIIPALSLTFARLSVISASRDGADAGASGPRRDHAATHDAADRSAGNSKGLHEIL